MQFSQVIGQQHLKEQLVHMVQQNRLSHALLFLGKEGSGALSLARAMAQYTVCEAVNGKNPKVESQKSKEAPSLFGEPEPVPASLQGTLLSDFLESPDSGNSDQHPVSSIPNLFPDSCGTCPSCLKAAKMIHPDIHFSFPVIPKKSGDKPLSTDYI